MRDEEKWRYELSAGGKWALYVGDEMRGALNPVAVSETAMELLCVLLNHETISVAAQLEKAKAALREIVAEYERNMDADAEVPGNWRTHPNAAMNTPAWIAASQTLRELEGDSQ